MSSNDSTIWNLPEIPSISFTDRIPISIGDAIDDTFRATIDDLGTFYKDVFLPLTGGSMLGDIDMNGNTFIAGLFQAEVLGEFKYIPITGTSIKTTYEAPSTGGLLYQELFRSSSISKDVARMEAHLFINVPTLEEGGSIFTSLHQGVEGVQTMALNFNTNNEVFIYDNIQFANLGGGTDPILKSDNATDQTLSLTGIFDVEKITNLAEIQGSLGNPVLEFKDSPNAVNHVDIDNAEAGTPPTITSEGPAANIDLIIRAQGTTAQVQFMSDILMVGKNIDLNDNNLTNVTEIFFNNQLGGGDPVLGSSNSTEQTLTLLGNLEVNHLTDVLSIRGSDNTTVVEFENPASSVNFIDIVSAATLNGPIIRTDGADVDIDLNLSTKGLATINLQSPVKFFEDADLDDNVFLNIGQAVFGNASTGGDPILFSQDSTQTLRLDGNFNIEGNTILGVGILETSTFGGHAVGGTFRLANLDSIDWLNDAGDGDLTLGVNSNDELTFRLQVIVTETNTTTLTNKTMDADFNTFSNFAIGAEVTGNLVDLDDIPVTIPLTVLVRNAANTAYDWILTSTLGEGWSNFPATTTVDFDGNNIIGLLSINTPIATDLSILSDIDMETNNILNVTQLHSPVGDQNIIAFVGSGQDYIVQGTGALHFFKGSGGAVNRLALSDTRANWFNLEFINMGAIQQDETLTANLPSQNTTDGTFWTERLNNVPTFYYKEGLNGLVTNLLDPQNYFRVTSQADLEAIFTTDLIIPEGSVAVVQVDESFTLTKPFQIGDGATLKLLAVIPFITVTYDGDSLEVFFQPEIVANPIDALILESIALADSDGTHTLFGIEANFTVFGSRVLFTSWGNLGTITGTTTPAPTLVEFDVFRTTTHPSVINPTGLTLLEVGTVNITNWDVIRPGVNNDDFVALTIDTDATQIVTLDIENLAGSNFGATDSLVNFDSLSPVGSTYILQESKINAGSFYEAGSLDQTDIKVTARNNPGQADSLVIGGWFAFGGITGDTATAVYTDFILPAVRTALSYNERIEYLPAATNGETTYLGLEPTSIVVPITLTMDPASASNQQLQVKALIDRDDGNGYVDLPDNIETDVFFKGSNITVTVSRRVIVETGDKVKYQKVRGGGVDVVFDVISGDLMI